MRLNAIAYYADFFLCAFAIMALALCGLFASITAGRMTDLAVWIVALPAGLIAWSLAEYWVHRYFYHEVPILRDLHEKHHAEPEALIGGPPLLMIVIIFTLAWLPLIFVSGPVAQGFTIGVLVGYMAYMLVHHAVHHWHSAPGSLLYALRHHHARHHYRDDDRNFGIITPFWDGVFGTSVPSSASARRRRSSI